MQTHQPDHPLLEILIARDYHPIAKELLTQRKALQLPPFKPMAILRAESTQARQAQEFLDMARSMAESLGAINASLQYLGPLPALMEKRSGRYRYYLQIEATTRNPLQQLLSRLAFQLETQKQFSNVRWSFDVDPQEF